MLVQPELGYPGESLTVQLDQLSGHELGADRLDIAIVGRQVAHLERARLPHQSAFTVALAPQGDVEKPSQRGQRNDVLAGEELGLDGANAGHVSRGCRTRQRSSQGGTSPRFHRPAAWLRRWR